MKMIDDKKCIILVGTAGSGKTECKNILEKIGYSSVDMGIFIKQFFNINQVSRQGRVKKIFELIEEYGRENFINSFVDYVSNILDDNDKGFVVCGMRNPIDLSLFISHIKDYDIVHVFACNSIRLERIKKRNRPGDPQTYCELKKIDSEEMKFGLAQILNNNDFHTIPNQSNLIYLEMAINNFIYKYK